MVKEVKKKNKTYWLAYDLGVGGDYQSLYAWLDDHEAKSCGDSLAYFKYSYNEGQDPDEALKKELCNKIKLNPNNKLYIIRKKETNDQTVGSFIFGKRNASPWEGFGSKSSGEEDA